MPYTFEIKDAPNAQATPLGGSADGVKDDAGNPPQQAYRFKLRTKDGTSVPAAIAVAEAGLDVSDLRWETQEIDHGEETVMHARVANYDGKPIRFVVEHDHGGRWAPFAQVPGVVKDGEATGKLLVHHPLLPPTGALPSAAKLSSAKAAQLRFFVERGEAKPQERAEPKHPKATSTPPRTASAGLRVFDLRWEKQEFEHGEETVMHARLGNYDGKEIRFVVEYQEGGDWKPFAEVPGTVEKDRARAGLMVHHPILPPTGPEPLPIEMKAAKTAELRFHVEYGKAKPQERAGSGHPKATSRPVDVQTGTLVIKGALAGQTFFLVHAGTNRPVRVGKGYAVTTTATAVKGVYFILPRNRTAKFEHLPAGPYKVIFPAEQVEGKKPEQPVVKANAHGAHVVDIKDFVHRGAVCEIEVAAGASPNLELTLSADGIARVCC